MNLKKDSPPQTYTDEQLYKEALRLTFDLINDVAKTKQQDMPLIAQAHAAALCRWVDSKQLPY
jgi:dihydropteroate synthase